MKVRKVYIIIIAVTFVIGVVLGNFVDKGHGVRTTTRMITSQNQAGSPSQIAELSAEGIPEAYQGKLQLFILAGQSNMSGSGDLPKTEPSTNPRIFVFGNDYHWKLAKEPVDDPTNQVDLVSLDEPAGFSPAVSFATTLLSQRPDLVIGLIPCAKGGSSIDDWRRGLNDNRLYGSCLKRVRAASVMGNVASLLFFQGEIDTVDPQEAPERTFLPHRWAEEFTALVKSWRSDLDLPELPVVFAQLGTNTEPDRFKNWEMVKAQQRQVQLPLTTMITTDDLALRDYAHFTTQSYQVIGQRFANAYLNLVTPKS